MRLQANCGKFQQRKGTTEALLDNLKLDDLKRAHQIILGKAINGIRNPLIIVYAV